MRKGMGLMAFGLSAAMLFSLQAAAADPEEKASQYLEEYYGVSAFSDNEADAEKVNEALSLLGGEKLSTDELSVEELTVAGLRLAGLEELALTYVNDEVPGKAAAVLQEEEMDVEEEYAPYIACALDLELYDDIEDENGIEKFLYRCLEIGGKGRRYVGRIQDDTILSALSARLSGLVLFDDETLSKLGEEIVLSGAATGYSLKYTGFESKFLADDTILYSHSEPVHAIQLIGLLKSEGIDGYVEVEPKVSVYEYLMDWGDPGDPTPSYAVRETDDGRYLCFASEYDLAIEFDNHADKERFHSLIETYAKKYDDRVDDEGNVTAKLLAGSWWQPLYSSLTETNEDVFGELTDNVIYNEDGSCSIHTFTLPEKADGVRKVVEEAAPELEVSQITKYVNPAFIRYQTGEDYQ